MDRKEVGFVCSQGHVTGTVILEEGRYRQIIRCHTLDTNTQMQCLERAYSMEEGHELMEPPAYEWSRPYGDEALRRLSRVDFQWVRTGGLLMRARRGKVV